MYDFDTLTERKSTYASKWEIPEGMLPMWIADMDFKCAPEIVEALRKRVDNEIFGYTEVPDVWYDAYINWWHNRHRLNIKKEYLVFCTGVVPALSSAVRKLTTPGENVLIQTPVYNIFFNSIINNGRNPLDVPLHLEDGVYSVDWENLEKGLSDPQTTLFILCNPQNPGGIIWDKETLARIGELCYKYNVTVISDEIHCDIMNPGESYVPFASVSDLCANISITCIAPSKCFNLAGLQSAAVMVPNENLRHKIWRQLNTDEVAEPNAFAIDSTVAAFTKGENWLNAMNEYVYENKKVVADFVRVNITSIKMIPSKATYLLWFDCRDITDLSDKLADYLKEKSGLFLSTGSIYGKGGEGFLRMNVACPRSVVLDGLNRLKEGIDSWNKKERG